MLKEAVEKRLKGEISVRELSALTNTAGKYLALLITEIAEEKRLAQIQVQKVIDV
jgi:hypothetical protein